MHLNMRVRRVTCFGLFLWTVSGMLYAGTAVLSEPVITDVSDRSFSIVWTSSEPADPSVAVFTDAAATQPAANTVLTAFPVHTGNPALRLAVREQSRQQIMTDARNRGVMKLKVSGLAPQTTYYLKLGAMSQISQQTTLCPDAGALLCIDTPVLVITTEAGATREYNPGSGLQLFTNDQLLYRVAGGVSGDLVISAIEGARYPVSSFVGDGVPAPFALVDLNNLYSNSSGVSQRIAGSVPEASGDAGEVLIMRHYKGISGSVSSLEGLAVASHTGEAYEPVSVVPGDCNRDGVADSYDDLLLGNMIAGGVNPDEYAALAFHPLLCDLYRETGLNSLVTRPELDLLDTALLEQLLVGGVPVSSLPRVP